MEVITRFRSTPEFDVELFGCRKDLLSKVVVPVTEPDNKTPVPPCVVKLISCSCLKQCVTNRCGYNNANLACILFSNCIGTSSCTIDAFDDQRGEY